MKKLTEFERIYCLYRKAHDGDYAAQIARGIVFAGLPF